MTFVADAEDDRSRTRQLLDVAREFGTIRDADTESGTTSRLLQGLEAIRMELGETPAPAQTRASPYCRSFRCKVERSMPSACAVALWLPPQRARVVRTQ
jgi:hypothetical protein